MNELLEVITVFVWIFGVMLSIGGYVLLFTLWDYYKSKGAEWELREYQAEVELEKEKLKEFERQAELIKARDDNASKNLRH